MTYVLILAFWAGGMSKSDAVSMTSVRGFATEQECKVAGDAAKRTFETMVKTVAYVCAKQSKS